MPSTSSSISRWAAKLIISRNRSASGVFSTTARRFMMSLVIGSSSNQVDVHNPTVPGIIDDHPAKPLPRYSALWGALARGFATAELHHSRGPDQRKAQKPAQHPIITTWRAHSDAWLAR